jgi:hypothetical protein
MVVDGAEIQYVQYIIGRLVLILTTTLGRKSENGSMHRLVWIQYMHRRFRLCRICITFRMSSNLLSAQKPTCMTDSIRFDPSGLVWPTVTLLHWAWA